MWYPLFWSGKQHSWTGFFRSGTCYPLQFARTWIRELYNRFLSAQAFTGEENHFPSQGLHPNFQGALAGTRKALWSFSYKGVFSVLFDVQLSELLKIFKSLESMLSLIIA